MKISPRTMAIAIAGLLWCSPSFAQQPGGYEVPYQPSPKAQAITRSASALANNYESYYADGEAPADAEPPSPSDAAPFEGDVVPSTVSKSYGQSCRPASHKCNGGGIHCRSDNVELGEPFALADHTCWLKEKNIQVAGWMANSYTWNPYNPSDRFNGPVTWTDQANTYQLNELYIYAKKDVDTEGSGWDIGGRADALYGTSYRWDTAGGLETHFGNGQFYGLALPQFYGEIGYNDLKVKVGHFISPVGYYTVGTYNNFFNTLPYTYQYGEPFTHTGVWATWQASEKVNVGAGIIHGWDAFDNTANPHAGYLGTLSINGNHDDSLALVQIYSMEPNQSGGFSPRYFQTLVYSRPLNEKWTYIAQSDLGVQSNAMASGKSAYWYGVNNYLYWKKNDLWSWGLNFEWFRDEEGFRVGQVLPSLGSPHARGYALSGFAGNFFALTFGPRWTPLPNLVVRPNLRCDWYQGPRNAGGLKPYDGGLKNFQQILATDAIITF
ncbi:MAG TPA: outer membrane beta-barrel protein [Pirellulales bacterium]|jgi:hypothetical protein|nr:outer membrane beta-barrel protein [Pirellulales bacterium]